MIDLHVHTIYSDGKNSIEEMVLEALEIGITKIAITDHIWRSSEWFDYYYYNEIINLRKKYSQTEILIGFEAKALSINGEIDANDYMCKKADIRIGAIHRIPKNEKIGEFFTREEVLQNKKLAYKNWLNATLNIIRNKNVDIIAHPCMVLNKYNLQIIQQDIYNLFKEANKYNKKLEISSRYKKSNIYLLKILEKYPYFVNNISYGSDAHSVDDLKRAYNE